MAEWGIRSKYSGRPANAGRTHFFIMAGHSGLKPFAPSRTLPILPNFSRIDRVFELVQTK